MAVHMYGRGVCQKVCVHIIFDRDESKRLSTFNSNKLHAIEAMNHVKNRPHYDLGF